MSTKRRNFRVTFAVTALLLLVLSVLLTDVLGGFGGTRIDLTSERLYTMAPAAKDILKGLKAPVQVKLYITGAAAMPTELKTLERDVTDKLRDYAQASDGMIQYSIHDPQDDEDLQAKLAERGVQPFQVQSIEKDEIGVKLIWSAMTVAYKDRPEEVMPQILPQSLATFEYDLISRIYRLTRDRDPKVALVAPLQEIDPQVAMQYLQRGMQPPEPVDVFTSIAQYLQQEHYQVERVSLTADSRIPADADALLVLNPSGFDERQAFEINRAISNGTNTLIAVQLHTYGYEPGPRGGFTISGAAQASGLESVLDAFGVTVDARHLLDASHETLAVPRTQNVGGMRFQTNEPVRLPVQVKVTETQMNQDSPLSNRISSLLYLWGTALDLDTAKIGANGLATTVLFTSSERAWRAPFTDGMLPGSLFSPEGKQIEPRLPLAVLLEGSFPDAFAGRPTPAWPAPADPAGMPPAGGAAAPLQGGKARVAVIGCAKMFDDMGLQAGQNALLLLNTVDALTNGEQMISIRSKALTQRVIRPVDDGEKLFYRLFAVVLVPAGLAVFGLLRAAKRRKEAAR
ncbi:MAG: GldG family protein [Candidatus Latescibacteria bacterium]|nr:GldG family protein [Candidatus Latescibacterota bacterium]